MFKGLRTKIESEQLGRETRPPPAHSKPKETPINTTVDLHLDCRITDTRSVARDSSADPEIQKKRQNEELRLNSHLEESDSKPHLTIDESQSGSSKQNNKIETVIDEHNEVVKENHHSESLSNELTTDPTRSPGGVSIPSNHVPRNSNQDSAQDSDKIVQENGKTIELTSQTNDAIANLRGEIESLKSKLTEKTRQLKINLQNMNDIKRALQREIADHSRTQDELNKLQSQFKSLMIEKTIQPHPIETTPNGNHQIEANVSSRHPEQGLSDKDPGKFEETNGVDHKLDIVSNFSQSSTSVDELDSSEANHNNPSKEVNHEYLKNVLFRYMTSTDTETTQHLVKALSVLMKFTPEQSAAVKSAMHSRFSWLRLKK